ncbi:MAG: DNA damage-inducible protein D [Gammaproteobacteria bacterium]|nr:DNA damage-inducible protein D [Gammaproteobacteria bacterium]
MNELEERHYKNFEQIKSTNESDQDFWHARDLQIILEYAEWRNFCKVIEKAKTVCVKSGFAVNDHFVEFNKMVDLGSRSQRQIEDVKLSRYACYLIVQNGDPSKPVIANGQTYFAIQTRRQELSDNEAFRNLGEDEQRLFLRNEMKAHNKLLVETASVAGVKTNLDFAVFQNHGYKGLYGGLDAQAIHQRKELKKSQKILDHMGSTELAANLFRATQTEEKLKRDKVSGKKNANQTHFEVGAKVRDTIKELGGIMPEDLQKPDRSIKQLVNKQQKKLVGKEENKK